MVSALLAVGAVHGERLPLTRFGSSEGLPSFSIHRILRDSRGYMWLCTAEGVVFFDGYQINSVKQLSMGASDMVEAPDHTFWLATRDGVVHYTPGAPVQVLAPGPGPADRFVNAVRVDSRGVLWAGTDGGLFRLASPNHLVRVGIEASGAGRPGAGQKISAILEDRAGEIWAGGPGGLSRVNRLGQSPRAARDSAIAVLTLAQATDGKIWIGTENGAGLFDPGGAKLLDCLPVARDVRGQYVQSILQTSEGEVWMGSLNGLAQITRAHDKFQVRQYGIPEGLSNANIEALAEDSSGNIWIGTDGGGAMRLSASGFTSFGKEDGLDQISIGLAASSSDGGIVVLGRIGEALTISRQSGEHFLTTRLPVLAGSGWGKVAAQDDDGSWWLATGEGAVHLSRGRVGVPAGWARNRIFRLFRDSTGRLWMSASSRQGNQLLLASSSRQSVTELTHAPGLPDITSDFVSSFAEDGNGDVWIGFLRSGVARYHSGVFHTFSSADAPSGGVRWLYSGPSKQMWAGTSRQGLCRINTDLDRSATSRFSCYGVDQGLSSNSVLSVVADLRGRIYAGTGKGVDRLDSATGAVQHYSSADGLVPGEIEMAARDASGVLWFGAQAGISRLTPKERRPGAPSVVLIRDLSVNGNPVPLMELGMQNPGPLQLAAGQNQLQLRFTAAGSYIRYSYQLFNVDAGWSAPSQDHSIHYAQLAPGSYQFRVRAVDRDGVMSQSPAEVLFSIAAPFWRQWWFQLSTGFAFAGVLYSLHRTRVSRLIAMERIRLRIATDLHDDIGSSLSQIAILSEAAGKESENSAASDTMAKVASISREVVDSMSDIVWAINPKRDHVRDLAQRMRRFASDVLAAKDIEFTFMTPPDGFDRRVPADVRRQILLVFKEAVNNLARHSGATEARIEFRIQAKTLLLDVADDGHGFDLAAPRVGNGLASMQQRVSNLGGVLKFEQGGLNGKGTTLSATFILR